MGDRRVHDNDNSQPSNRNTELGRIGTANETHVSSNATSSSHHMKKSSLDFKYDEINRSPVPSPE